MAQYIYGKNMVMQRLNSGKSVGKLFLLEGMKDQNLIQAAKKANCKVEWLNRKKLDAMAEGGRHQGVIAEIEEYRTYSLQEILDRIPYGKLPLLVMLDQLEDPHNLGAILRTCDAVGADGVIIKKNNSVKLGPTVAKVSTGAIETIPVHDAVNLTQTLETLKEKGFWVYGTDARHAVDYRAPKYDTPVVLVIGSEGKGISRLVLEHCDQKIMLPMHGSVTSLNASVATAICLYEILSKRNPL